MKSLLKLSLILTFAVQPTIAAPQFVVCIDPGHPSETSRGATANGLTENNMNWHVAVRIEQKLRTRGIATVLTKTTENETVTNRRRAEIANGDNVYKTPCAAFIRLHCDAGGGSGFTWFHPDRSATKQGVTGPPVEVQKSSRALAHAMNEAMKPVLRGSLAANPIKTDASTFVGGKQGGVLTGSIFARVPTALIEMCYITNRRDAKFIGSAAGQNKMAEALAAGIEAWKKAH